LPSALEVVNLKRAFLRCRG
jgi:hypothetical protein